jgi:signal transduction histidine kinase
MLPEYPVSREEQKELAAPETQSGETSEALSVPSQLTFAQEVRAERLGILWKITLFVAFLVWWALIVISGGRQISFVALVAPTGALTIGSLMTGQFLRRERFAAGVWAYSVGVVAAIALAMGYGGTFGEEYAPYIFPLLLFVVGLLLPVRDTLALMLLVLGISIAIPSLAKGDFELANSTGFALALTLVATGLSAQVSGELYAIAEWALENYRKERQTTFALFESREALQKSLLRQQSLTLELQETNQQLELARQAAEEAKTFRGQFLANMSHELRTPLNAIIGFSQTMLDFPAMYDGVILPEQYSQDMNQILSSGKHLLNIINDILDLSKVDAGKLDLEIQPVDLGPVVKGVLSTAVGLVGDKGGQIELKKQLPDPLPMCLGDPLRVRQVLLNLYSNAAKFTDQGHIKLSIWADNGQVIFAVEDTGIGISEADKTSIFEEFRQGTAGRKKGRQGAGLGLAISQQLMRLMSGRLWFESVLGKGTTFFFSLPLYVVPTEQVQAVQTEPAPKVRVAPAPKPEAKVAPTPKPEAKPAPEPQAEAQVVSPEPAKTESVVAADK